MTLTGFKNRTMNILYSLDAKRFQSCIGMIDQIQAADDSGFSDIEAKAKVMQLALMELLDDYYQTLTDPIQLLLAQIIFRDHDEISLDTILSPDADIQELSERGLPPQSAIKEAEEQYEIFTLFLNSSQSLRAHYESKHKSRKWIDISHAPEVLDALKVDVDMLETNTTLIWKKTAIGTKELACCTAVCIYAKNKKNKTIVSVTHEPYLNEEMMENLKFQLNAQYSIRPETLEVYLAGGNISSFAHDLALVMQTSLGITDMRLGLSDSSLQEGSAIGIFNRNEINYCFEKSVIPKLAFNAVNESKKRQFTAMDGDNMNKPKNYFKFFKEGAKDESLMQWIYQKDNEECERLSLAKKFKP